MSCMQTIAEGSARLKRGTKSFCQALRETGKHFCENTSIQGIRYVVTSKRSRFERILWMLIMSVLTYTGTYLISNSWHDFMTHPTYVTWEDLSAPISRVYFPGVAICDINKISRGQATVFASQAAKKLNISESALFRKIPILGRLTDYDDPPSYGVLFELQQLLDMNQDDYETKGFSTYNMMKQLVNPCATLIRSCRWKALYRSCEELFVLVPTQEGFCCLFNYVPPMRPERVPAIIKRNGYAPLTPNMAGHRLGLSLTIYTNTSDYMYTSLSSIGSNIQIFSPHDFPDVGSGGLLERLISPGAELFLGIAAEATYAKPEVMTYDYKRRNCMMSSESKTSFGHRYSFSDCLLECRITSIVALCKCIPYQYINSLKLERKIPQCTLNDLLCLSKYRAKWNRVFPYDYSGDDLDTDKQDSTRCPCVPNCEGVKYYCSRDYATLYNPSGEPLNHSIVHIFFEKSTMNVYRQDVVYYWFEIVSNFGGICGVLIGISLLSLVELIYFFTFRLWFYFKRYS